MARIQNSIFILSLLSGVFFVGVYWREIVEYGGSKVSNHLPSFSLMAPLKPQSTLADYDETFKRHVDEWNNYMSKSGGYISCDPRFGLVESGACDRISFTTDLDFPFSLPYRINVDSKQNLHLPLFSMVGNKFDYTWTYYADGTWSRVPGKHPTSLDNSYRWEELAKANGFPTDFKMCKDCDRCVCENHDKFLREPSQRAYVYRAVAAQTQPASSS